MTYANAKCNIKWQYLVSGVSAGVVSTLLLHPLDLVKIRFQVNEGTGIVLRPSYLGLVDAFKRILRHEGVFGLYQGVAPNVVGAGSSWGIYFVIYNAMKEYRQEGNSKKELQKFEYMALASLAGSTTLAFTNPIWVIKTRLCLQYDSASDIRQLPDKSKVRYTGIIDCFQNIVRREGFRALYKGFVPGLVGTSHGAVQFVSYESMKNFTNRWHNRDIDYVMSSFWYAFLGSLSKIIAAASTYPYQVVRSRLQDQHRSYNGLTDVIVQLWRFERIRGFYKGLLPNLLRVTPASGIIFLVYENMSNKLLQLERLKNNKS